MQYEEYVSVWKRSFLALLFAFGFGLAILNSTPKVRQQIWTIFYLGLLIWCTTEISQKVFFEELIFFLALTPGLLVTSTKINQINSSTTALNR